MTQEWNPPVEMSTSVATPKIPFGHDILTKRPISHDEARESLQRLINSHFNNPGEHGRMSIPANPDRDDDLVLAAYIRQQRAKDSGCV